MKSAVSGPVGAIIIAVVVIVVAVLAWKMFKPPTNTGATPEAQKAYQQQQQNNPSANQYANQMKQMGARRGMMGGRR